MLGCLHEPEMAFRQGQRRVAQDRADNGNAERLDGIARQPPVALAAQPVEDDAGDADIGIISSETLGKRCRRLRLARYVEDKHDRQAIKPRQIGGRA